MKTIVKWLIACVVLAGCFAYFVFFSPTIRTGTLNDYAGKDNSEVLWRSSWITPALKKLLGDDYQLFKSNFQTESPAEIKSDYLVLHGCRLNNESENALIAISLKSKKLHCIIGSVSKPDGFTSYSEEGENLPDFLISSDYNTPSKDLEKSPVRSDGCLAKIKGLYIGMDVHAVSEWFKDKLGKTSLKYRELKFSDGVSCVLIGSDAKYKYFDDVRLRYGNYTPSDTSNLNPSQLMGILKLFSEPTIGVSVMEGEHHIAPKPGAFEGAYFIADPLDKIQEIVLLPAVVNYLFETADMETSTFVSRFCQSYKISSMRPTDDNKFWSYTSPDGVKITIDDNKLIDLRKVATEKKIQKAFD